MKVKETKVVETSFTFSKEELRILAVVMAVVIGEDNDYETFNDPANYAFLSSLYSAFLHAEGELL